MPKPTESKLQAVVFDWAGTTVDYGCQGPVQAFVESFASYGITITANEAREPMGMGKREHVAALCAMPRIAAAWKDTYGKHPTSGDIDAVYIQVERLMLSVIHRHCILVPGLHETVGAMRERGLKIGSCTGYPRSVGELLAARAAELGYQPDVLVCATDVAHGRPAPDMALEVLSRLGAGDPARAVKIGDTVNDVLEGLRAGMWVIGITLSSNQAGLSAEEVAALSPSNREALHQRIAHELAGAGAHFTAETIADCLPLLDAIEKRC